MRTLCWLLVVLPAFSGCAGDASVADDDVLLSDGSRVELGDVETTARTGAIAGVVVDTAIVPVVGINVTLDSSGATFLTDVSGIFRVPDLEPGVYFMHLAGTGYLPTQTSAEVKAGEVTKVRIVIDRDPTPPPYHTPLSFDWYDSAGQPLVDFAIDLFRPDGVPAACDTCEWEFTSDGSVESFIIEGTWTDSIAPPHKPSEFYWTLEPTEDTSAYESDYFENPGYARIDGNRWGNHTTFFVMFAYEEEWIALEQSATFYITLFYGSSAPDGWSIVAGDS